MEITAKGENGLFRLSGNRSMNKKCIVLLGGTGVIGSEILRLLDSPLYRGKYKVVSLVRKELDEPVPDCVKIIKCDLANLKPEMLPCEEHCILHFARKQADRDGRGYYETNVNGTRNLLNNVNDNTLGIIYGSSLSVYGMWNQDFVSEKAPAHPMTDLAISRYEAENLIRVEMKKREKSAYILRPRFIFGRGDKTLAAIVNVVKKGIIFAAPENKYSFISVNDYAKIIVQLVDNVFSNKDKPVNKIINIGYNNFYNLKELVTCICNNYQIAYSVRYRPLPQFFIEMLHSIPNKKLKAVIDFISLLGWSHYCDVSELESEIGTGITGQDSLKVFSQLLKGL